MTAWSGEATWAGAGTLSEAGAGYKYLVPDADSVDGSWIDQTGGTSLFAAIDELPIDDSDLIRSQISPTGAVADVTKISLGNPSSTPDRPFVVAYRYGKTDVNLNANLDVRLLQGSTEIAAWTHNDISSAYVNASQELTSGQFNAISDFSDLYLEFTANKYYGPGDVIGSALAWWGLRAYTRAGIGGNAVRLRESGGNTEQTFTTVAGGGLDLAAIRTFAAGANLFVVTLYDQSGGSLDATQATAGTQPPFTIDYLGKGLPAIGPCATHSLNNSTGLTQAQPFTLSSVCMHDSSAATQNCLFGSATNQVTVIFERQEVHQIALYDAGAAVDIYENCGGTVMHSVVAIWNVTFQDSRIDGFQTIALKGTVSHWAGNSMGGAISLCSAIGSPFIGYMTELGLWAGAFSNTQVTNIQTNQKSYWRIPSYAGAGDVVGGAYGWWGLRAYSAGSIGLPVVRLRRSSDSAESDFVAGIDGSLDSAAIAVWRDAMGAATLSIAKLYDQTRYDYAGGVGFPLPQTTASKQPTFVLSGSGTRPVMRFSSGSSQYLKSTNGLDSGVVQPFTMSTVVKRTANFSTAQYVTCNNSSLDPIIRFPATANSIEISAFNGGTPYSSWPAADSTMHAIQAVFNGSSSDLNVDGSSHIVTTGTDGTGGNIVQVGSGPGEASGFLDGDLVEIGYWPGGFTAAQSTAMAINQKAYWGF